MIKFLRGRVGGWGALPLYANLSPKIVNNHRNNLWTFGVMWKKGCAAYFFHDLPRPFFKDTS